MGQQKPLGGSQHWKTELQSELPPSRHQTASITRGSAVVTCRTSAPETTQEGRYRKREPTTHDAADHGTLPASGGRHINNQGTNTSPAQPRDDYVLEVGSGTCTSHSNHGPIRSGDKDTQSRERNGPAAEQPSKDAHPRPLRTVQRVGDNHQARTSCEHPRRQAETDLQDEGTDNPNHQDPITT
jgi:hypothetical protein